MQDICNDADKAFYGTALNNLVYAQEYTLELIDRFRSEQGSCTLGDPIDHCKSRIKSAESMCRKLNRSKLPQTADAALAYLTDAVGIRIICRFIDDVYTVAGWIQDKSGLTIQTVKDYIRHPKQNGYRSYHIIIILMQASGEQVPLEIQIRTIAQDCWASLEHQMKYKHNISNQKLIESELKRCANEIAATDISMQTIRELIQEV